MASCAKMHTPESWAKISASQIGKKMSPESIFKSKASNKANYLFRVSFALLASWRAPYPPLLPAPTPVQMQLTT